MTALEEDIKQRGIVRGLEEEETSENGNLAEKEVSPEPQRHRVPWSQRSRDTDGQEKMQRSSPERSRDRWPKWQVGLTCVPVWPA